MPCLLFSGLNTGLQMDILHKFSKLKKKKRLVRRVPGVMSVILRNINPGHTRPERHVWPERRVKLAFKHTNVNFIFPSYPHDSACYIPTHK